MMVAHEFDKHRNSAYSEIIKAGILALLLASQAEVYGKLVILFILLFLAENIEILENQY